MIKDSSIENKFSFSCDGPKGLSNPEILCMILYIKDRWEKVEKYLLTLNR